MELLFKERLRQLRQEKGLTQVKLGKRLGYGYTAIANYESGRNQPSLSDLMRLCEVFEVSADYILGMTDARQPDITMNREDLVQLHDRATALAEECRRHLV